MGFALFYLLCLVSFQLVLCEERREIGAWKNETLTVKHLHVLITVTTEAKLEGVLEDMRLQKEKLIAVRDGNKRVIGIVAFDTIRRGLDHENVENTTDIPIKQFINDKFKKVNLMTANFNLGDVSKLLDEVPYVIFARDNSNNGPVWMIDSEKLLERILPKDP